MTNHFGRTVGVSIVALGLLALVLSAPAGDQINASETPPPPARDWSTADTGDAAAEQLRAQTGDRPVVNGLSADSVLDAWGEASQKAAKAVIQRYGQPDEVSESALVWHNTGAFQKTIVHKEELPRNFPAPHADVLEQFVEYAVPYEKYGDLARFDGSLHADRTAGTLSARGPDEADNFIALNLAHEIIATGRTVESARQAYARASQLASSGKSTPYSAGLLFKTRGRAQPDPDRSVLPSSKPEAQAVEKGR